MYTGTRYVHAEGVSKGESLGTQKRKNVASKVR